MHEWDRFLRDRLDLHKAKGTKADRMFAEFADHLEDLYQDAISRGDSEEGARQKAEAALLEADWQAVGGRLRPGGGKAVIAPKPLDALRKRLPLDTLATEIRFAARLLRKSPGLSAIAVLTLGLGIGLTATMFSIVHGTVLKGLPFEGAERLMALDRQNLQHGYAGPGVPIHDFVYWREQLQSFESLSAYAGQTMSVFGEEGADSYAGARVTANAFDALGVPPVAGRGFRPEDDLPGAPAVVMLGYHVWESRFAASEDALGQSLLLNGEPTTIIGVMPDGFRFPFLHDLWTPLRLDPLAVERGRGPRLEVYGKLRASASQASAQTELGAVAQRLASEFPTTNAGLTAVLTPYADIGKEPRATLFSMLAAVLFVLLISCLNVANLLLARASSRSRELAIRAALGAGRARVILLLVTEGLVLAAVGGGIGVALAALGIDIFERATASVEMPFWIDIGLHAPVLAFIVVVTIIAGVLSGLLPAIKASGLGLIKALKDEAHGSSGLQVGRVSRSLIVAEVALSVALLVGAGLMIRSVSELGRLDYGFATSAVLTGQLSPPETTYKDGSARQRYFERTLAELEGVPGVQVAALSTGLPGVGSGVAAVVVEGQIYERPSDLPLSNRDAVSAGFFEAFAVGVLEGRSFDSRDRAEATPVAIVNESFAQRFLGGDEVIGRRIRDVRMGEPVESGVWRSIVGLVPDLYMSGVEDDDDQPAGFYVPLDQTEVRVVYVALLAAGDPLGLAQGAREAVARVDPTVPLISIQTVKGAIDQTTWYFRVFGGLFVVFGFAALFLAAVGLYGVLSTSVGNRTREMGIRMTLGARAENVRALVVRQALAQVAVGLGFGLILALLISRGLSVLMYRVDSWDPITFGVVVLTLLATGLLAAYVPARRAGKVDLMVTLRH